MGIVGSKFKGNVFMKLRGQINILPVLQFWESCLTYLGQDLNCKQIVSLTQSWRDSEVRDFGNVRQETYLWTFRHVRFPEFTSGYSGRGINCLSETVKELEVQASAGL